MDAPDRLAEFLAEHRPVVLTGAGMSTESGIPDYRGPDGRRRVMPMQHGEFVGSSEARQRYWARGFVGWTRFSAAGPNAGHRALVELERRGRLHALVTQNINGLHQRAGNSAALVIEVHGTVHDVICMSCSWRGPMLETLERVRAGEDDPPCRRCGGILKSATISFGQPLVPTVINRAMRAAAECDVLLAIGTSLQVYPVAGMVPLASNAGARIVIINAQATPFDEIADAVISTSIGEALPMICSRPSVVGPG